MVTEQDVRDKMEQLGIDGYSSMDVLGFETQMAQLLEIQKLLEKRAKAAT